MFGLVDEVSHLSRQLVGQRNQKGQVREGQVRADPVICDGENVYHRRLPHRLPIQGDLLGLGPVGQKQNAQHHAGHDGNENDPERRFLIRQHRADPMLRVLLPKGQRDGLGEAGLVAQVQERGGVACGVRPPKGTDHGLVRGSLKVSSEEVVRKPENGIEPVEAERDIGQGFRQIVPAADVSLLMEQNIAPVGFR